MKVRLTSLNSKDALIMQRFDHDAMGGRISVLSLLALSGKSELTARCTSRWQLYFQLVQHGGGVSDDTGGVSDIGDFGNSVGEKISWRIATNIMLRNNDDHARNHTVLWDGAYMRLTPAFGIKPVRGANWDSNQAISFGADGQRESRLDMLTVASCYYGLSKANGQHIIEQTLAAARDAFTEVFGETELSPELTAGMFHPSIWEDHPLSSSATDS